jgi:Inorganic Pyrophosphatase
MSAWPHIAPRSRPEEPDSPFRWATEYLGLTIDIETDAGDDRTGTSDDGTQWSHRLPYPYGEVRGSLGADGDPIDVYLGPQRLAPYVYVIQTKFPGSKGFDETKSMIGFSTQADAEAAFRSCYGKPGFHLDTIRWPAAAWAEAMGRPGVSSGEMGEPLKKASHRDQIPGGRADDKTPADYDRQALATGTAHEKEHTQKTSIAREIAMDHLEEDDRYYEKLADLQKAATSSIIFCLEKARANSFGAALKQANDKRAAAAAGRQRETSAPIGGATHAGQNIEPVTVRAHTRHTDHGDVTVPAHIRLVAKVIEQAHIAPVALSSALHDELSMLYVDTYDAHVHRADAARGALVQALSAGGPIAITPELSSSFRDEHGPIHNALDIVSEQAQDAADIDERARLAALRAELEKLAKRFPRAERK